MSNAATAGLAQHFSLAVPCHPCWPSVERAEVAGFPANAARWKESFCVMTGTVAARLTQAMWQLWHYKD